MENEGNYNTKFFRVIFLAMLFLHVFSYFCHIFRIKDIKNNGRPDIHGILRARRESSLNNLENFLNCIICGFIVKTLYDIRNDFNVFGAFIYCIMMDIIVTVLFPIYSYITKVLQL